VSSQTTRHVDDGVGGYGATVDFLWQGPNPDWGAIELAVDDLSAAIGLIVAERGLDEEHVA
jgi:hypothetical protein